MVSRRLPKGSLGSDLGCLGVHDVDWISSAWYAEDGGVIEILAKLFGIQCGTGDQELQVRPEAGNVLDQAKEDVCVQCSLVSFIHHHDRVGGQIRLS